MMFVDTAVGSRDLAEPLRRKVPVELTPLQFADVEFAGRGVGNEPVLIGVECKRMTEITSDWDRFAGEQLPKMVAAYDHRWLLLEGEWRPGRDGRLQGRGRSGRSRTLHGLSSASLVQKRLLTLELCGGFHVLRVRHRAAMVSALVDLYRWWTDEAFDEHKSHIVNYQPHGLTPLTPTQAALAAWPGLGLRRARAAAAHFGSVRLAATASVSAWAALTTRDDKGKPRAFGTAAAAKLDTFLNGGLDD